MGVQYGALMIVDPEEEVHEEEVQALAAHVGIHGLGLVVFGEWYNVDNMVKMRFFDDNTRSWWTPVTGEMVTLQPSVFACLWQWFLGGYRWCFLLGECAKEAACMLLMEAFTLQAYTHALCLKIVL